MTSVEEKIDLVKSRLAGNLRAIRLNKLLHAREFILLKPYMSFTWKKLS
jgi:hypothetical protein